MAPMITYNNSSTELHVAPVSNNTTFTLRMYSKGVCIMQNDDIIAFLTYPIMKIVHNLRKLYPMAKLNVI